MPIGHLGDAIWHYYTLDYYLWGAVKDTCYAVKPETIGALKDSIREAIG